jgi:DNA-binding transcriptional regulator LsrR (DeoR family)
VSRLLTAARRDGVVTITVEPPTMPTALADELTRSLRLRAAYVAPSPTGQADGWADLAVALGQAIDGVAPPPDAVVVTAWGRTIWETTAHPLPSLPGATVAPMMAAADEPAPWFETNAVTRRVAGALGATPRLLYAPVHPQPALRAELLRDEDILRTLKLWDEAHLALTNIGAPPRLRPDYGPAHHLRKRDELARAVGDVGSRYFDHRGQPVRYEEEGRFLGMQRAQIEAVPRRIGIAVGQEKAVSIVGAGRSGLVDVVVTDARTARAVLDVLAKDPRPGTSAER